MLLFINKLIDNNVRWNSTHDLLENYLNLESTINITIDISKTLEEKKHLKLTNSESVYIQILTIYYIFFSNHRFNSRPRNILLLNTYFYSYSTFEKS